MMVLRTLDSVIVSDGKGSATSQEKLAWPSVGSLAASRGIWRKEPGCPDVWVTGGITQDRNRLINKQRPGRERKGFSAGEMGRQC